MTNDIEACIASLPDIEQTFKDILSTYNVKISPQANIKNLIENNSKNELEQCVTYIRSLHMHYPTIAQRLELRKGKNKPDYAGDISIFINGVIEIKCEVCDKQYCHSIAENTMDHHLTCFICNRYSHKPCYEGEIKQGLHFICSICNEKKLENPEIEAAIPVPTKETAKDSNDSKENAEVTLAEDNNSETLCPLLAVGECPHGISGKGCSFKHPKWCWKYQKHGDREPDGCRRRDKCWYYHPKLCENSLKLNVCLNSKCKEHHLEGTRRYQPRNQPPVTFNQPGNSFTQPGNSFTQAREQQRLPPNPFQVQSESDFPSLHKHTNKQLNPWNDERASVESEENKMESFLEKYTAKMSSHFASTISTQVNMAVQQSISPLREEIKHLGRSQIKEPPSPETSVTPIQEKDIQSLVIKYLQNLVTQKPA